MNDHTHDSERDEAREALESINAAKHDTAQNVASPTGYYALAGFGQGLAIIGVGMEHSARWAVLAIGLIIMVLAMQWYTKKTGVVAWATLRESGAWRAWIMAGVAIVAVILAAGLGTTVAIIGGVVTFVTWAIMGPAWDRAWVASLTDES